MIQSTQGAVYLASPSVYMLPLYRAFTMAGGCWSRFLIWDKNGRESGEAHYQRHYEVILYGWPAGNEPEWAGNCKQSDIWSIPQSHRYARNAKPVELVERAILNSSRESQTVLDPFAGMGTTLIACERQQRKARLIENDPRLVDAICQRWQTFTGQAAVRKSDRTQFEPARNNRRAA